VLVLVVGWITVVDAARVVTHAGDGHTIGVTQDCSHDPVLNYDHIHKLLAAAQILSTQSLNPKILCG